MSQETCKSYSERLQKILQLTDWMPVGILAEELLSCWKSGRQVFICGNGGSAANAMHIANDFIYGAGKTKGTGLKVEALSANSAILTCLANDIGYSEIFSEQLRVKANPGDVLIALSGSGNSPNIVRALEMANQKDMKTFAILGFDGGQCKFLAQHVLHFEVNDMQISEDLQLIVGHMCMQEFCRT